MFFWMMAVGDSCVADLLDTVQHEMDSIFRNHHVYKSVWSPVMEQLILEKEPANQSTRIYSGSYKGQTQIEGCTT